MHRSDDAMDAALTRRLRIGWPVALACTLALVPAHPSRAADDWALCAPPALPPPPAADLRTSTIEADSASLRDDGVSVVEGNVTLRTPERTITSDRMNYDADAGRAEASGRVTVREHDIYIEGTRLEADFETGETVLDDATFRHSASHGRGDAKRIENDPRRTIITGGSFTTCDPGSSAWRLEASSLVLDRETGTGTARHARLRLFELPVLYTPWISFPIDDRRKSGLLLPSFESSNSVGTSLTVPVYLNLAPNYDATLRPRLTSRRGEVLGGQFRLLGERGAGTFDGEILPEDRITGGSRSLVSVRYRHRFAPGLDSRLEYARASDIDYLRDLRSGSASANVDHLRRFAELAYELPALRLEAQVEDYQVLDTTRDRLDPYRSAPRLALESRRPERNRRINFDFRGELTRFDHRTDLVASGTRLDLRPSAVFPFRSSSGYLIPRATLHYTGYDLDNAAANVSESPSRVVPSFSIDGGLYFDHEAGLGERRVVQTIEPRLFYLRVAHRDQDHLPLFDAGSHTFGYDHMFRENRFSGIDRVGDADRLTLALDSRLLSGGREILMARLGKLQHFRDRRVRLCTTADREPDLDPGRGTDPLGNACRGEEETLELSRSSWILALKARPHRSFTIGGSLEHGGDESRHRTIALDLRYHPSAERIFNIGYRRFPVDTTALGQVRESVGEVTESVGLSGHLDLGRNLRVLGIASYSLDEDTLTELYAGIEYESCCWRMRVSGQRYLPGDSTEHDRAIMLQLELKGFTGFDFGADRPRDRPIPGFRNRY